jgi:hypothetical protein
VKLRLEHSFDAPLAEVIDTLASSAYAAYLASEHSFFADVRVLSCSQSEHEVQRVVHYRGQPFIARLGMFSLPAEWFVWVEHSTFDRRRGLLSFDNVPEVASVRSKVVNRGTMKFTSQQGEDGVWRTLRTSEFELDLKVPALYRPLADLGLTLLQRQLQGSLDEEARLLAGWLGRNREASAAA